jgi:hypothetical protein
MAQNPYAIPSMWDWYVVKLSLEQLEINNRMHKNHLQNHLAR